MREVLVRILIVDDKPENLIAMQAAFKDCGYGITVALSGKEALEHVQDYDFACILLDVQMPVMDGFEAAKLIRKYPRSKSTPIIFATAIHRTEAYEEMGYVAGAVDYIFKPLNTAILRAKVRVFVELFLQSKELRQKNILLEEAIGRAKENEQLKQALAARDEFLLMASHELMTPITPLSLQLQTFIELFKEGKPPQVEPARLIRMLNTSQGQVERLSRLVGELVDVSKLSSQKLEIHKEKLNLHTLTKKVLEDFSEEIKKSHCEVSLVGEEEVCGVWDSFRIEQVVINLLKNSLKYGPGKPIEITIRGSHHAYASLAILDHGIGISKRDQLRIFDRFERAVSAKSYSGLGLGLYISQQIVELHQGRIKVDSELGGGSKFTVELPCEA
ncbi:MAG TPA: hybrid sensor histidine kinase/response regulator [Bacteriovoracaceae bacterium]|nr:hybrid sensor histidine kinase/response regulator [Bacteriovoracaceae bacterium]